jgi:hypothetical protein
MPIILATQEAEIRRTSVQSQPGKTVHETLSQKTHHKKMAGGVTQNIGCEFKFPVPQKKVDVVLSMRKSSQY